MKYLIIIALSLLVVGTGCQKEETVEPQLIQVKWAHTHSFKAIGNTPISYCTISETYLPEARYWAEPSGASLPARAGVLARLVP